MIFGLGIVLSIIAIATCAGVGLGVARALWILLKWARDGSDL